uniref:Uncharacterized protein n=1 Tax=Arundo donax TaxID=35708 RepID=A0A0A9GZQ0_ARUDO
MLFSHHACVRAFPRRWSSQTTLHYTGGNTSAGAGAGTGMVMVVSVAPVFVAVAAAAGPTGARHMGHVECARSQASTHSAWNECAHLGRSRTFSPGSTCPRHTEQSSGGAPAPSCANVGSAAIASALMPRSAPDACASTASPLLAGRRRRLQTYQSAR